MGPRSTSPFLESVLDECQQQYGAIVDMDFPKMVLVSLPTPFYLDHRMDEEALKKSIIDGVIEISGFGIDYLVIPCNTAHLYMDAIVESTSIPVIDMVEMTVNRLKSQRCALLATPLTVQSELFQNKGENIEFISEWQDQVNELITGVKAGINHELLQEKWKILLHEIWENGIRQIVIGCTDLSLFDNRFSELVVIDAMEVLAEETVKEWRR
jgi:aspartate racemase